MNSKKDKIELIIAIKEGEITPDQIEKVTIVISDEKEAFTGLMISLAHHKKGSKSPVIYVGEARKKVKQIVENLEAQKEKTDHRSAV